jgi:hypothetical protein
MRQGTSPHAFTSLVPVLVDCKTPVAVLHALTSLVPVLVDCKTLMTVLHALTSLVPVLVDCKTPVAVLHGTKSITNDLHIRHSPPTAYLHQPHEHPNVCKERK